MPHPSRGARPAADPPRSKRFREPFEYGAGLLLVAGPALLAVPEVALATTGTTFGDPLDTVQDIVGGTTASLSAEAFASRLSDRRVAPGVCRI